VLRVDGTIIEESLMLEHAVLERNVIILAPATERMEQKDGVLVTLLDELLTGVLEEKAVTIMERVANLESVDGISTLGLDLIGNLAGEHSVLVHAVIELDASGEVHRLTRDEPWALSHDGLSTGVGRIHAAENTGADFFLAVSEELGLVNDSVDDTLVADGEGLLSLKSLLLVLRNVHGDGAREQVAFTAAVGNSAHLHALEQFHLVHESLQGESPALRDSLQVLNLVLINLNRDERLVHGSLLSRGSADQRIGDTELTLLGDDLSLQHVVDDLLLGFFKGKNTSVDIKIGVLGGFIRIRDTSEFGDNTSASLGIKTLNITALSDLEGGGDVGFDEFKTGILVELLGNIATFLEGCDESDKDNLSSHVEEL